MHWGKEPLKPCTVDKGLYCAIPTFQFVDVKREFDDVVDVDAGCSHGYILHDGQCLECPPGTHANKAATACVNNLVRMRKVIDF